MGIIRFLQPRSRDCSVNLAASSWVVGEQNILSKAGKGDSGFSVDLKHI